MYALKISSVPDHQLSLASLGAQSEDTALMRAVADKAVSIAEMLIKAEANVNVTDKVRPTRILGSAGDDRRARDHAHRASKGAHRKALLLLSPAICAARGGTADMGYPQL